MEHLRRLQCWFKAVVCCPSGISHGIASPDARRHVEVSPNGLESVVRPSRSLSALARLNIYRQSYFLRLLECLRAEFPSLAAAMGAELFDALSAAYLEAYPSQSPSLSQLGARLPQFLRECHLQSGETGSPEPSWPEFLSDLAGLERVTAEV